MREIPLTQGRVALVDDEDYETLARAKWYALRCDSVFYAVHNKRRPERGLVYMHRVLLGVGPDIEIDHWNHDGLDNQRVNLRACTRMENNRNSRKRPGTSSRYKGVSWNKHERKWQAYIARPVGPNGKARRFHLGLYSDEETAAHTYDGAAIASFGAFACTNFGGAP